MEKIVFKEDSEFRAFTHGFRGYVRLITGQRIPEFLPFLTWYLTTHTLSGLEFRLECEASGEAITIYGFEINEILIRLVSESMLAESCAEVMYA